MLTANLLTSFTVSASFVASVYAAPSPAGCFPTTSALDAITCLEPFTVPKNKWTSLAQYNDAALSDIQQTVYLQYVDSILAATDDNDQCPSPPIDINAFVGVSTLPNAGGCIIYEKTLSGTKFARGLPIFAAHSRTATSRFLHFGAPHPLADGKTNKQAAAVFDSTRGRTLTVAGRHRDAYMDAVDASISQSCNRFSVNGAWDSSNKTDAAHHDAELFHRVSLRIRTWQNDVDGGCPEDTCAYLQFHGMGVDTCAETVFISAGIQNIHAGIPTPWYSTAAADRVNRFRDELVTAAAGLSWEIGVPVAPSTCALVATTNIFGRVLNGVDVGEECDHPPLYNDATGEFISIEQDEVARHETRYDTVWRNAIIEAFDTDCAAGTSPSNGICV